MHGVSLLTLRLRLLTSMLTAPVLAVPLLTVLLASSGWAEQPEIEFFEKKIRPVLVEHCYQCHSAESEAVKGGLLLDHREGMLQGGDSGPVLVPGKAAESLLISSLRFESYEMPPAGKLPESVIRDFETWIAQGAIDPRKAPANLKKSEGIDWEAARQFWAFRPLPEVPAAPPSAAARTAHIDRAVEQELAGAGLTANPAADPSRRLRRLYYDLTGLPPTPAELLDFMDDPTPARWEQTVDRLLASPQFGEKWGRHWLDVVRYADSNGGDFNATYHNAWRYRDYVIESFNQDKPINEFFEEQIAGDLLPALNDDDRRENLVATGLLMIGPKMLSERDKVKLKYDVVDEQIDSFGKIFLGLSLGCARCHDHKFDPVPTADYYALAGIFAATQVLNGESQQYVSDWLRRDLPTSAEHLEQIRQHDLRLTELRQQIKSRQALIKKHQAEVERLQQGQAAIVVDNTQAELVGEWKSSTFSSPFIGTDYIHDNKTGQGTKHVIFRTKLKQAGKYQVLFAYVPSSGREQHVPVEIHHAGQVVQRTVNETKKPEIQGHYTLLGEFDYPAGAEVEVKISNTGTRDYVIVDAVQWLRLDQGTLDPEQQQKLELTQAALQQAQQQLTKLEAELKTVQGQAPPPVPQAIAVRDEEQCSDCTIMIRGEHTNPGRVVPRGTLQIIDGNQATLEITQGSGRRELANWLVTRARDLSSRVYVNRVWTQLLGEGLVRSVDNFGIQGIPPSHPQLLDDLAGQFIASGWSTKQLIRSIVLTDTYQRSTQHHPEMDQIDPENRLLWRAHRRPLSSEEIRDTFLVLREQLDPTPGGSSVSHLGKLVVNNSASPEAVAKLGSVAVRRSVYLPVLRSELEEIASLFDFANPELVVGKRPATNVPAQALFLLNHPQTRQTAEALVNRLFAAHGSGSFSGLPELYLQIFGRLPEAGDDQLLQNYLTKKLQGQVDEKVVHENWSDVVQALLISTEFRYLD